MEKWEEKLIKKLSIMLCSIQVKTITIAKSFMENFRIRQWKFSLCFCEIFLQTHHLIRLFCEIIS